MSKNIQEGDKMIILVLLIILFLVSYFTNHKSGIKSFISLILNFLLILISLVLINWGVSAYIISLIACPLIAFIIIFYLNGFNKKTKSAYYSILILLILTFILTYYLNIKMDLRGFSLEKVEEISAYSFNIGLNLESISFMVILFMVVGTCSDTAMAISSSLYEIDSNANLPKKELFKSGMNVGRDILGTTTNTLFFSFISAFLGFLLWHSYDSFIDVINYSGFASKVLEILESAIACVLIIPICNLITIYLLKR